MAVGGLLKALKDLYALSQGVKKIEIDTFGSVVA